jgi:hypothetical protein
MIQFISINWRLKKITHNSWVCIHYVYYLLLDYSLFFYFVLFILISFHVPLFTVNIFAFHSIPFHSITKHNITYCSFLLRYICSSQAILESIEEPLESDGIMNGYMDWHSARPCLPFTQSITHSLSLPLCVSVSVLVICLTVWHSLR